MQPGQITPKMRARRGDHGRARVLVVSNLYPPDHIGGYELGCSEVVSELHKRGWALTVLTSRSSHRTVRDPHSPVMRLLHNDFQRFPRSFLTYGPYLAWRERRNRRAFRHAVAVTRPDVVYLWNLRFISASVLFQSLELGFEPVLYVSDDWLYELEESDRWLNWMRNEPARYLARLAKRGLKAPLASLGGRHRPDQLAHAHVQFASSYLRSRAIGRGRCSPNSPVIHWGVNTDLWHPPKTPASSRRLLFVGQIAPEKGVHTVIEAIRLLRTQLGFPDLEITIAGGGVSSAYVERVHSMASDPDLGGSVRLVGRIERSALPDVYRSHAILVFASEWEEPFSITLLEAMASGLAIVATLTGGTPEVVAPETNALTFSPGDPLGCAKSLCRLLGNPGLMRSLGQAARTTVVQGFRLCDMVSQIEDDLAALAARGSTA